MRECFKKGDVLRHFKRELVNVAETNLNLKGLYIFVDEVTNAETNEIYVLYYSLEYEKMYIRNKENFYSLVDKKKYPEIKQKYRFEKIEK